MECGDCSIRVYQSWTTFFLLKLTKLLALLAYNNANYDDL